MNQIHPAAAAIEKNAHNRRRSDADACVRARNSGFEYRFRE